MENNNAENQEDLAKKSNTKKYFKPRNTQKKKVNTNNQTEVNSTVATDEVNDAERKPNPNKKESQLEQKLILQLLIQHGLMI